MNKIIAFFCLFIFSAFICLGQTKLPPLDKSTMDMSYYPTGYPLLKISGKVPEPLIARVIYSRPVKNGRVIFGDLLEYGKVWRLGANEATEIEFYQNVKINGSKVKKGRYTMYCIPNIEKWTIILNKENDAWGSFKYEEKMDLLRVDLPVQKQSEITEAFTIVFEKAAAGANLIFVWDDIKVSLPINF
jgi:hypothetical protein